MILNSLNCQYKLMDHPSLLIYVWSWIIFNLSMIFYHAFFCFVNFGVGRALTHRNRSGLKSPSSYINL